MNKSLVTEEVLYNPKYRHCQFDVVIPQSNGHYFKVYIFAKKQSMYNFRRSIQKFDKAYKIKKDNYAAATTSFRSKFPERNKQVGVIVFYTGAIGSGIVSHEMTHAVTFFWTILKGFEAVKIFFDTKHNEDFCFIQGELVSQFWENFYNYVEINENNFSKRLI